MPPSSSPSKHQQTPPKSWCGDQQRGDGETGGVDESSAGRASNSNSNPGGSFEDPTAEAVRRLEDHIKKISSSEEATEISREQVEFNDQLQNDEVLALEAIYGDDVFTFEQKRGLRTFQIHVHVDLPKDFTISALLHSSVEKLKPNSRDNSDAFMYSFKVQFLPPITLTCFLPLAYPTHHPPFFTVHVKWLDCAKISSLCRMLDEIWSEQPGLEVLYHWAEWLRCSSLPHLGFDRGVTLEASDTPSNPDARAIPMGVPLEVSIPTLIGYNEERCHDVFLNGLHQCVICYSEYAGAEFIKLPCGHFFCVKCMETYSIIHVREGTVTKLLCPDTICRGFIPPALLRRLLGSESYERWESLLLQKTLASMSDVVYCPRCGTACLDDERDHAQCSKCYYSFCSLCKERRHVGLECLTPEAKLLVLQERQKACRLKRDQHRELEQINEILSVKEALRDAKQCPCCKMAISRTEGCNKMVCRNCMHYFCYNCNKEIDGYDHFKEGCELFPIEEIIVWGRRMNPVQIIEQFQMLGPPELIEKRQAEIPAHFYPCPPQVIQQRQAEMPVHGHPCPRCGQLNAKVGYSNCIICRSCHNRYCALCGKVVRRSSQHFGPKGCRQHSAEPRED